MDIVIERIGGGRMTLEDFAERHGLRMIVGERSRRSGFPAYYASFERIEIKDGSILRGVSGDGETPEEAIADYAKKIAGERLVFGAYTDARRVFEAPNELDVAASR